MPIGNGIAVTAMQMLDVYMTLANDGVARHAAARRGDHRRPTATGTTSRSARPTRSSRRETAKLMREMLAGVVEAGTGTKAAVPGYTVAGKTGTARKPPYDQPPYQYVASFVGFAPAENPRLADIVVLDEPGQRSSSAARRRAGVLPDHAARPGGRAGAGIVEPRPVP